MFELSMTHAEQGYRFYRERKIREAVKQFLLSAEATEDPDAAALERWLSYMTGGEFELAWRESDRVLQCRRETAAVCSHLPEHQRWLWDGTPLEGRSVLVRCFHGLGDTIQFVRFLPQLRAICRDVQILPQPELHQIIPPILGGRADLEIELMEAPHALRITLDKIPAQVPYLALEANESTTRKPGRLRIGLAWASGAWRPERSIPLPLFEFLNDIPDMELTGLQRGPAAMHLPPGGPTFHEADWGNTSVADTARTIRGLDLIITTDTMVAHLAGALGAPVWTLLHWDADWRWLDGRDDSPWYSTMRLFRQQRPGDWAEVLRRVRQALWGYRKQIRQDQARAGHNAKSAHAPQNSRSHVG